MFDDTKSTFQLIVQYLLIAQIGLCHKKNKILIHDKTPRWLVDKEAVGLVTVQQFFIVPSETFVVFV